MSATAVIAEYNPLHNGHVMHLEAAREASGGGHLIAVMSGDYVQRGCPAIISKYERTRSVLLSGADLAIELPVQYSTGSLEYFATGAISLIKKLGIADCISFGSECGDMELLKEAAEYIEFCSPGSGHEPDGQLPRDPGRDSAALIRDSLAGGSNYSHAVNSGRDVPDHIAGVLSSPNNLLAAAYIKAARVLSFDCDFHTMKRAGSGYHDTSAGALSSSSLRNELLSVYESDRDALAELNAGSLKTRMPDNVYGSLCNYLEAYPPVSEDDLSLLLFHALQAFEDEPEGLTAFLDVSSSLSHKIIREYAHASSYSDLCMKLKSKDLNYARISRALLHILLDIRTEDIREYIGSGRHFYIRPLGFRRSSSGLMRDLKLNSSVPVISKNADAGQVLKEFYKAEYRGECAPALKMFRTSLRASDLYNRTACNKCRQPFISEYERSMIIV